MPKWGEFVMQAGNSDAVALALLFLFSIPLASVAQESTESGSRFTAHGDFRGTRFYEDRAWMVGGGVGMEVGPSSRIGLVGFGTVGPSLFGTLEFHLAYGGIRIEQEVWRSDRFSTAVAVSGGGGRFWNRETRSGVELRTGVGVVEPEVLFSIDIGSRLQTGATLSYRWVTGIEGDILNRSDGDVRGIALGLRLGVR